MKHLLASLVLAALLAPTAHADGNSYYGGARAGFLIADASGYDSAFVIAGFGGRNITDIVVMDRSVKVGVEAEYLTTIGKADRGIAGVEWEFSGISVFGTARHDIDETFYARIRAGFISGEANYTGGGGSLDDTSYTSGIAAGMSVGDAGTLEIDWTGVGEDLYSLTVGFVYPF